MQRAIQRMFALVLAFAALISFSAFATTTPPVVYKLDSQAAGAVETINNIANLTVVSKDANELRAEYRAGFVQGHLQARPIVDARDNTWDLFYLLDPSHSFPKQIGPTRDELAKAGGYLNRNYTAFLRTLTTWSGNPQTAPQATQLKRLLFRMLGIYHGATRKQAAELDFSGNWLPDAAYFRAGEMQLHYGPHSLTFMDVYFLNAGNDLGDIIAHASALGTSSPRGEKCSAFLKRVGNDVILAHNSWMGFLSQTMVMTLAINDDLLTVNAATPGLIGSATDFGYNNKGMMFNETTHRVDTHKVTVQPEGLWIFWRAALAEQFSTSIDDFFRDISLENSGTYLNGYMLVDAKNGETGLVEMSYRCFVYFRSNGGAYTVTTANSLGDGKPCSAEYDHEMVTPDYLMGINYPASLQVREDLGSTDNRPARRRQFAELLPGVIDDVTARLAITYTDPANPLSIFGRWDLGYGETLFPKTIPDGAIDAKVASTATVKAFMQLSGELAMQSRATGFWMLYGTPIVNGSPFIWSRSVWKSQILRGVPDRLDGTYTAMPLHLK